MSMIQILLRHVLTNCLCLENCCSLPYCMLKIQTVLCMTTCLWLGYFCTLLTCLWFRHWCTWLSMITWPPVIVWASFVHVYLSMNWLFLYMTTCLWIDCFCTWLPVYDRNIVVHAYLSVPETVCDWGCCTLHKYLPMIWTFLYMTTCLWRGHCWTWLPLYN